MRSFLNKIKEYFIKFKTLHPNIKLFNRWYIGAAILCFLLSFAFILIIFGRYNSINQLRSEFSRLQNLIETSSVDIAYDNIKFNIWWPMPIVEIKNLKIYSKFQPVREWNIENVSINTAFFDFHTLVINLSAKQSLVVDNKTYQIDMPEQNMSISYCVQSGIKEILLGINNLKIKDVAVIEEIKFGAQRMAPQRVNNSSPLMETHTLINNIKFDTAIDVPLSHTLDNIYINANVIGTMKAEETYLESIYDWLASGGKVEIEKSSFEWKPLLMVSRGDLYFNEKLEPRLHLSASSRALIPVMDIFEEKGILERKGVFVTRILLRNKAFKMSDKDEYDTVLTPIDYENGKISVENIPVASF